MMNQINHFEVIIHSSSTPHFSFQFFIYASFFAAISLLFTLRGVYTVIHMGRSASEHQPEKTNRLPEDLHQ